MQKFILFLIILITSQNVFSKNKHFEKIIQNEITQIDPNINIGIKVRNLTTGKIIYEFNNERYYNFASSVKLLTIAALQEYFGSDYNFVSKILNKGKDYYLYINDPDFSITELNSLLNTLRQNGIKTIQGNFYIINSQFSLPAIMEGKMVQDIIYCYGSPITKTHIDKNCVKLIIRPNEKTKSLIQVLNKEAIPYHIVNTAITVPNNYPNRIYANIKNNLFIVSGTLNQSYEKLNIAAVANDNLVNIKLELKKLLAKNNILLKGKILYSKEPKQAKIIVQNNKTFHYLASKALQNSDNFITDYLLAEFADRYGADNWKRAGELLKQLIQEKFNVNLEESVIVDGSGLSRYNMLTVAQMDSFLTKLYNKTDSWNLLSSELPNSGKGTLNNRFLGVNIFAKSGTMSGISSLIGYVADNNKNLYSFVIVSNNYLGPKKKYAELEEKIIRSLIFN